MCRLLALTSTDISTPMRRFFFHQLMLASVADHAQMDGAGVSDGVLVYKHGVSYLQLGQHWTKRLDEHRIWMGHVRTASTRTEVSPRASHPYIFNVHDQYLYAAHNGFITGTVHEDISEPNVDSFRALKRLAGLLHDHEFTADTINAWTAGFGIGSEWAFMMMYGHDSRDLYIIRGIREVHFMRVNNGYVFNTSSNVLLHVKNWVADFFPSGFEIGPVCVLPEYTMTRVTLGSHSQDTVRLVPPASVPNMADKYLRIDRSGYKAYKL